MKIHVLLFGVLFSAVLACASKIARATQRPVRAVATVGMSATKPAKQPAPKAPPSPTPAPDSKEPKPRPTPPAHLFM